MNRVQAKIGYAAAILILLSGAMHSVFGWKVMRKELTASMAPPELIKTLGIGWIFGGVAMLALGTIAIAATVKRGNDPNASLLPVFVIGIAYVVFGAGAMSVTRFDPFFLVFILPGLLLVAAAWPTRAKRRA
jgi:hypothetical protein